MEIPDLEGALTLSSAVEHEFADNQLYWCVKNLGRSYYKLSPSNGAACVAVHILVNFASQEKPPPSLLPTMRDILGNPFRPSTVNSDLLAWNGGTVLALARSIQSARALPQGTLDSDRLAILADALEDAGCTDEALLTHCRAPGPHHLGCWAIDVLLGLK